MNLVVVVKPVSVSVIPMELANLLRLAQAIQLLATVRLVIVARVTAMVIGIITVIATTSLSVNAVVIMAATPIIIVAKIVARKVTTVVIKTTTANIVSPIVPVPLLWSTTKIIIILYSNLDMTAPTPAEPDANLVFALAGAAPVSVMMTSALPKMANII